MWNSKGIQEEVTSSQNCVVTVFLRPDFYNFQITLPLLYKEYSSESVQLWLIVSLRYWSYFSIFFYVNSTEFYTSVTYSVITYNFYTTNSTDFLDLVKIYFSQKSVG